MGDQTFSLERPQHQDNSRQLFIALVLFLSLCSAAFLLSASYGYALNIEKAPEYFFLRHVAFLGVSFLAIFLPVLFVPIKVIKGLIPLATLVSVLLLVLCLIPGIGITKNGAHRWIGVGTWQLQPSEIFKPVLVLYMAYILERKREKLDDIVYGVLPPFVLVMFASLLVFLENDFSTAALLVFIALAMMWLSNIKFIFFIACVTVFVPLVFLTVLISDYRLLRIVGFMVKDNALNLSYQITSSIRAIMSGGMWGTGLGQGLYKIKSIPEVQSDFVLAALVEEIGFAGILLYLALWGVLLVLIFRAAKNAKDHFSYYALSGIGIFLSVQILINMAVVGGILPTTGIIFPLLSSGGSGVIAVVFALAIAARLMSSKGSSDE